MPIDYKKYPPNWKSEIRPSILKRANNRCEICGVENKRFILRGTRGGVPAWQDEDTCEIFEWPSGKSLGTDYIGEVWEGSKSQSCQIVLTIAHLDHDISNNDPSNLKAMCQKCHLDYDKKHHAKNARQTRNNKKGLLEIDFHG